MPEDASPTLPDHLLAYLDKQDDAGPFLSAAVGVARDASDATDDLQTLWLREHNDAFARLDLELQKLFQRFEDFGEDVSSRVESDEYLALVRSAFRVWDHAETEDKRRYIGNLLANAAGSRICDDDVVRMFIEWIDRYHESHFAVVKHIYDHPRATRHLIGQALFGQTLPREDSAEADLFKLLIRDLSTGGVGRQERETTSSGDFVKRRSGGRRGAASPTMRSAFDDGEHYVLTELGRQFVHYTMDEAVTKIADVQP